MILTKSLLLLSAVLAVAFGQDEAAISYNFRPQARTVVHEINLNRAFDASLPHIRSYITKHELDPMEIWDIEIPLSHLPGLLKTKLHLHHGYLQQFSTIYRTGDVLLQFSENKVALHMDLGWEMLDMSYQYSLRYMLYYRRGDCYGRYEDINAKFVVEYDLEKNRIDLEFFEFVKFGNLKLKLEGNLGDGLINMITSVVTKVFKTQAVRMAEATTIKNIMEKIELINELLSSPVSIEDGRKQIDDIAPYHVDGLDSV